MKKLLYISLSFLALQVYAQDDESLEELFETKYETPLTIDLEADVEEEVTEVKEKKKKINPKIFYGIKTKRGFTRHGFGDRVVVELFHYLKDKDYVGPDEYVRDFYWYDFKKKKIVNSTRIKKGYAGVLHGHYVKKMGDQVLEEGYFYKGMKHGRWVRLSRHDILMDKEVYWKGWTKQSMLSYYDFQRTQLKEIIPVHYGEKQGEYFAYHSNGNLAVVGYYQFNDKVGIWREYYPNTRVKREIKYPLEPFDDTPPVILKEWDEDGRVIYDREKFRASLD
ncbi:toxin-antitoxin system YwqK family antitoxin [Marinoscillum sp. MHG1-6]|uniref:toxin-antitoxin system YwqK family antitoxin n=1 Tax=Marinoscillum sp. MHG1-6 TaxID=2959627 RepID=UPI00215845E2|nr:hypothetical protein [Marinoscillum sp. MHG1-6]